MTTRTSHAKGLAKPHKHEQPKPGIGGSMNNARSIDTEKSGRKTNVGAGLPKTFYGNSRSIDTDHHTKD